MEINEGNGAFLFFQTSELKDVSTASKKALYALRVKVLNRALLVCVGESRWACLHQILPPGAAKGLCTNLPLRTAVWSSTGG